MCLDTFWDLLLCISAGPTLTQSSKWDLLLCISVASTDCCIPIRALRVVVCMHAKSLQPCQTPCDPMHRSPPGSSVQGILQARILECVAISFSRRSSQPRDRTRVSYVSCIVRQVLYHQHHLVVAGCWHSGKKKKVYLLEKKKKRIKNWVKKENRLVRSYFLSFPHLQSRESTGETCG